MNTKTMTANARIGMNRREALGLLGAVGAGVGLVGAGCGTSGAGPVDSGVSPADGSGLPGCIVTPEAVEGPFFVEEKLIRSDLVAGETDAAITSGYPLTVAIALVGISGSSCQPLAGATVDVWQANVVGLYSDEPSNFVQSTDTQGLKYLRGYQVSDGSGLVTFKTIYPGWYATRTIHIHVKIRLYSPVGAQTFEANEQLYFSDAMNDAVMATTAYASRGPRSIPKNTNDQVYNGTGPGSGIDTVGLPANQIPPGSASLAMVSPFSVLSGSTATLTIGVRLA